MYRGLL